MTLKTKGGFSIPLGKIKKRTKKAGENDWYWNRLDYSEYVVYRAESVVIRYIIKIGDGQQEYSQQDLFMKTQEKVVSNGPIEQEPCVI